MHCNLFFNEFGLEFHTELMADRALELTADCISLATHKSKYFNMPGPLKTPFHPLEKSRQTPDNYVELL